MPAGAGRKCPQSIEIASLNRRGIAPLNQSLVLFSLPAKTAYVRAAFQISVSADRRACRSVLKTVSRLVKRFHNVAIHHASITRGMSVKRDPLVR